MDATAIEAILQAGKIGAMPFPVWLEQAGRVIAEDDFSKIARMLAKLGVEALRWEPREKALEEQGLWQAYLVVTLPSLPSLKLIHAIAVDACKSYFYHLNGQELWIEYLVARPEDTDAIEATLVAGKIGGMPFARWLEYDFCMLNVTGIANGLAAQGVVSVRWEESEIERLWRGPVQWYAYLVITLPLSNLASPPTLPSYELVERIAMTARSAREHFLRATEKGVELWVLYHVGLPLDDRAKGLLGTSK